jgi:hypothetical protein
MFRAKLFRLILPVLLFASPPAAFGQHGRAPGGSALPRVGMIDSDAPRSSRVDGCDSHLLSLKEEADRLFFESHPDGQDAWMNLDGRNVKLRLLKVTLNYLDEFGTANGVYEYSHKDVAVTVSLPVVYDYIDWVPAKVVLRKGRAVRTIRAFVMPQCDAL